MASIGIRKLIGAVFVLVHAQLPIAILPIGQYPVVALSRIVHLALVIDITIFYWAAFGCTKM